MQAQYNVLFLCTGNSARSIMAEAILNGKGRPLFTAFSAGSHPSGVVRPEALKLIGLARLPMEGLRSKNWEEFAKPGAPKMNFVVADGENEIHLRRSGLCELLPVLAAQAFHGQACQANQLESFRTHDSRRVASRAESCEKRPALTVENCLGHDGTSRIPRAQE